MLRLNATCVIIAASFSLSSNPAIDDSRASEMGCGVRVEDTSCRQSSDPQVDAACDVICPGWDYWICDDDGGLTCRKFA
jgi:hypothetical protein